MKKLITIIASALTLGAYAGQENVPVAFDTSSVPVGTEVNVEADGVVFATASTTGRSLFALLPSADVKSYGLKLAGETNNTVIDTDFTKVSATPAGWTATVRTDVTGRSIVSYNSEKGAYVTNWNRNTLYTDVSVKSDATTTIHIETYANGNECNATFYLAADDCSVIFGSSYNDYKYIQAGVVAESVAGKYASFKTADSGVAISDPTKLTEEADVNVKKSLTYDLTLAGATLSGTVTDGEKTANISFTLPEATSFATFGVCLDGGNGNVGIKSVTIKDDQVPPREPTKVYAKNNTLNGGFTLDGEDTDLIAGDVIAIKLGTMSGSQWQMDLSKHSGHNYVFEKNEGSDNRFSVISDIPVNTTVTINEGVQTYFYNGNLTPKDHAVANGVVVAGDGTLTVENIVTVNGNVEISVATFEVTSGSFKLADGATLKVPAKLADGKVTTDVANVRIDYDAGTKMYSLVNTYTIKIKAVDNTKVQYRNHEDDEWVDAPEAAEGFHTIVSGGIFYFQYVALEGYTVTGDQSGLKYTSNGGITANTTYNPATLPITVTTNVTQEDVDLMVEDVSESILDLINGALSVEVDTVNGVTITITGAATLEGLAESTAKTTLVGDGSHKPVTIPEIGSKKAGFYKVEATTAK